MEEQLRGTFYPKTKEFFHIVKLLHFLHLEKVIFSSLKIELCSLIVSTCDVDWVHNFPGGILTYSRLIVYTFNNGKIPLSLIFSNFIAVFSSRFQIFNGELRNGRVRMRNEYA